MKGIILLIMNLAKIEIGKKHNRLFYDVKQYTIRNKEILYRIAESLNSGLDYTEPRYEKIFEIQKEINRLKKEIRIIQDDIKKDMFVPTDENILDKFPHEFI